MVVADERRAEEVEVADGIQQFVAHEFVVKAQALFVQNAVVIHDDGVIQSAAEGQAVALQVFNVAQKAESAGAADFADVAAAGEVEAGLVVAVAEDGVVEVDGEIEAAAGKGRESRPFVAFAYFYGFEDLDEALGGVLLADARLLQEIDEGRSAAVHDGDFWRVQLDDDVINADTGERRHEMLNGGDAHAAVIDERGAELGVAHEVGACRDFGERVKVGAAEGDTAVGGGG